MDKIGQNSHNVITMNRPRSNAAFAPLSHVEAYWEALRGTRIMPNRAEVDPRAIESALEYAFIVERIAPGIARLRIAGSHLSELMGMEVRGMPLTSFFGTTSRRQISDTLEEVFETPATCTLTLRSEGGYGVPPLDAKLLLMPLKSDLGDASRILGVLVSVGDISRSPRRFEVVDSELNPIKAAAEEKARPVKPRPPVQTTPEKIPGFAEARSEFKSAPDTIKTKVPYLRLVKTDT